MYSSSKISVGHKTSQKRKHSDNPENRHDRKETERFKAFTYNELMQRDKANLDILWLKDESLEDTENLPAPDVLAAEITENLQSALEQFSSILQELQDKS
jgi:type I restriction enzyme M protein